MLRKGKCDPEDIAQILQQYEKQTSLSVQEIEYKKRVEAWQSAGWLEPKLVEIAKKLWKNREI